jgi:hypothetical protein
VEARRSIFSARADGARIGYIEGDEAFNVSGQRRCRYDGQTGNLRDLRSGEIVGHVSLDGRFVGLSWRADRLFRQFDNDLDDAVRQQEGSPKGGSEKPAGQVLAPAEDETLDGADGDARQPLRLVLAIANEVFGQRDAESNQGIRHAAGRRNPAPERAEPAIRTNAAGERIGAFPNEAERIFEMLRDRIGLSARDVHDVEEMPNLSSEREKRAPPTSSAGEKS